MEENKKVYIRSCIGRGSEVIDTLKGLGATKIIEISGEAKDTIYFIDHDNHITCALVDSEIGAIIMDNYREIELPQRRWKDGDILIDNNDPKSYAVFKEYNKDHTFGAYFILINKTAYFNTSASVETFHRATTEELKTVPRLFVLLMGALNEAGLCLPKNVAQSHLPDNEAKRLEEGDD